MARWLAIAGVALVMLLTIRSTFSDAQPLPVVRWVLVALALLVVSYIIQ